LEKRGPSNSWPTPADILFDSSRAKHDSAMKYGEAGIKRCEEDQS